MLKRHHMQIDVRGALRNPGGYKDCIEVDGRKLTQTKEIVQFFKYCLAEGKNFLPCGDCDGFDFVNGGCPGHEIPGERDMQTDEKDKDDG